MTYSKCEHLEHLFDMLHYGYSITHERTTRIDDHYRDVIRLTPTYTNDPHHTRLMLHQACGLLRHYEYPNTDVAWDSESDHMEIVLPA